MVYHLRMSREDPQMKIRLPADLKEQIEAASKNSGRSMNAEIVARLQHSFSLPDLSGKTRRLTETGEIVERDIVQVIADLQDLLAKAHFAASTLNLFDGVREENARRDSASDGY